MISGVSGSAFHGSLLTRAKYSKGCIMRVSLGEKTIKTKNISKRPKSRGNKFFIANS